MSWHAFDAVPRCILSTQLLAARSAKTLGYFPSVPGTIVARLRVAIRTEKTHVDRSVVERISANVINVQRERLAAPHFSLSALAYALLGGRDRNRTCWGVDPLMA